MTTKRRRPKGEKTHIPTAKGILCGMGNRYNKPHTLTDAEIEAGTVPTCGGCMRVINNPNADIIGMCLGPYTSR